MCAYNHRIDLAEYDVSILAEVLPHALHYSLQFFVDLERGGERTSELTG